MYKIINKKKLCATMIADVVGNVFFSPKLFFGAREEIDADSTNDILLIRTAYIGDVIMTLPVLKPLRERFRKSRISLLTSRGAAEVVRGNPFIDEIISYDPFWFYPSEKSEYVEFMRHMRKRSFDLVIEARADIREILLLAWPLKARHRISYSVGGGSYLLTHVVPYGGLKHKVEYHLDLARYLGCDVRRVEWGVYLSDDEQKRVGDILRSSGISGPFIAVHPGARLPLKRWVPERYAAVCDQLVERRGLPIVLFGAKGERDLVDEVLEAMRPGHSVNLAGALSLRELAGMVSHSALLICNDSAPMHIAASMKTPTVAVFGPSKSIETAPYGNSHRVVEKSFPCRWRCDENKCAHTRFHACMTDITVEEVLRAALDLLDKAA